MHGDFYADLRGVGRDFGRIDIWAGGVEKRVERQ